MKYLKKLARFLDWCICILFIVVLLDLAGQLWFDYQNFFGTGLLIGTCVLLIFQHIQITKAFHREKQIYFELIELLKEINKSSGDK